MLAGGLLPLAIAWTGKLIVDAVVLTRQTTSGAMLEGAEQSVLKWLVLEFCLVAATFAIDRAASFVRQLLSATVSHAISLQLLTKAQTFELSQLEDSEISDRLQRSRKEAMSRPLSVIQQTFVLLRSVITLSCYTGVLFKFSKPAALGLFTAALPLFLAELLFSGAAFRLTRRRTPEGRKLNYFEQILTSSNHGKEIKLFELGPHLLSLYRRLASNLMHEDRNLLRDKTVWTCVLSWTSAAAFYVCYAIIVRAAAEHRISIGEMTFYIIAFRQGQGALQTSLTALGTMYEDNLYLAQLFELLSFHPTVPPARLSGSHSRNERREKGIRFEGVGFHYSGESHWALRQVDLFIPSGQTLAIVGENGAGKSTIIKLLTGLYHPTEGRIFLDGTDLRNFDPADLRRRIAAIFQDYNRYQLTVRENVGFGSVQHLEEPARIQSAINLAGADELVMEMTDGVNTYLGRGLRNGVELSGGEWQKLALSRIFMRREADIVILDEPSSALDPRTEHAIFESLRGATAGKTTIIVSHRFSTVRMADKIVVISEGRIAEQGSHRDLLSQGGLYARLFEVQAQWYR